MNRVAIVGAGITGLVAAFCLKRRGIDVAVYESSTRAGGVIRTIQRNGFRAEAGPNTIMETAPEIGQLLRDLGMEKERIYSSPQAEKRFIVRGGKAVPLPASPLGFFTSPLFSASAKLHLLREPLVRRAPPEKEESLAEFVTRRLGREFLEYAINPFVAGVYAGDPARLSVKEAFPKLHALEQRYGSLILGQVLGARERKKRGTVSKQNAPKFSFPGGLEEITSALAAALGPSLYLEHSLLSIEQAAGSWQLGFRTPSGRETAGHTHVLLAAPAFKLAEVPFISRSGKDLSFLSQINYAPVSTLSLGFRREQIEHPLDGFGFLVPEVEGLNSLGAIFASSLFPNRAPEGHVLLTCYLGGLRAPTLPLREVGRQVSLALKDLQKVVGLSGQPVFANLSVHPRAIPQYELGYGRLRAQMAELKQACPGIHLAGNWRDGISLSDSILSGFAAAGRLAEAAPAQPSEATLQAAA